MASENLLIEKLNAMDTRRQRGEYAEENEKKLCVSIAPFAYPPRAAAFK
jgi:hypothetical protein